MTIHKNVTCAEPIPFFTLVINKILYLGGGGGGGLSRLVSYLVGNSSITQINILRLSKFC